MVDNIQLSSGFHWQGRCDTEDGALGQRIHNVITNTQVNKLKESPSGISILGFATDAGVARNKGRIGAKKSPDLIRRALANLAWHKDAPLYDLGTLACEDDLLETSQAQCAEMIASALPFSPVIVLGGGHEIAWSSFSGLAQFVKSTFHSKSVTQPPRIGIINFDAHFDLRAYQNPLNDVRPSSGTPFLQIHDFCQQNQWPFHYACLGVSRSSNTQALYQRANELGVWYVEDALLGAHTDKNHVEHLEQLQQFIGHCDYLYLTIDLDVFPASQAPGVSAPSSRGVSYDSLAPFLDIVLKNKEKLLLADIAEYNPTYDVDSQTARLAARLCWEIADAMAES